MTAYEDLALEAALHGGRDRVFKALLAHPLIGQYEYAEAPHRPADRAQPGASRVGMTARVLAVDAGNSKTDVAVVAADGSVLATARGGGFRPPVGRRRGGGDAVADAVGQAFTAAGVDVRGPCLGLSGQRRSPREEEQLAAALHARAWGTAVEVRNDTFAILRAGVAEPRGVAVVCGAGINCVGMRARRPDRPLPRAGPDLR